MVESHGGGESGEPGGHSLDTLKLTILDDLGAEAVSLGVALPAVTTDVMYHQILQQVDSVITVTPLVSL
jgi:hypothetical protein